MVSLCSRIRLPGGAVAQGSGCPMCVVGVGGDGLGEVAVMLFSVSVDDRVTVPYYLYVS